VKPVETADDLSVGCGGAGGGVEISGGSTTGLSGDRTSPQKWQIVGDTKLAASTGAGGSAPGLTTGSN